jgi:hypothetical protein
MKEGYYAAGGAVVGSVLGYMFGKSAKVNVPQSIKAALAKFKAYREAGGKDFPLQPIPLCSWKMGGTTPAVMYGLFEGGDPQAVVTITVSGGVARYELGQQAADNIRVNFSDGQVVLMSGMAKYVDVAL